MADFIGRFKQFDRDYEIIAKKLNLNHELPKRHSTKHRHWSEEIPETLIDRLYAYYREDFEQLGYEMISYRTIT